MMPKFTEGVDPWYWGTPEGSEMFTLLLGYEESFREKIEWLESAEDLVIQFAKSRENLPQKTSP
ncbi:MAG: hypothetical protein RLZZ505_894 [Verrucomicrobiota bacterium]|jgi:hypothetical protein